MSHLEKRKPTAIQTVPNLEAALGDPCQTAHSFTLHSSLSRLLGAQGLPDQKRRQAEGSWAEWGEGEKMGLGSDVLEVNLAAYGYEATCYHLH